MTDLFIGQTNEWLLEQLKLAQEDYATGKTLVNYSSGDSSGSEFIQVSPRRRIIMILSALKARGYKFGDTEISVPIDQTKPRFV